jgi:uncharacterized OB-fold protein
MEFAQECVSHKRGTNDSCTEASEADVSGVFAFIGVEAMTTYYCYDCWAVMDPQQRICPQCGADQANVEEQTYVEKLIRALRNPEPETPVRAAYILGQMKAHEAVPCLLELGRLSEDIYIAAAAIDALGEIGDSSIVQEIESILLTRKEAPVRLAIKRASTMLSATRQNVHN